MPPKKNEDPETKEQPEKAKLGPFPPRKETSSINEGFKFGSGDHPPLLGTKRPPKGKPGCLMGNQFVITGTMPSMFREDARDLIERYGGIVTKNISGKTDVLVTGCIEAGPAKIKEAEKRNIAIIDEDGLFMIIARTRPDDNAEMIKKLNEEYERCARANQKSLSEQRKEEKKALSLIFSEKYRPDEASELICDAKYRNLFKSYIKEYETSMYKMLIVYGESGCGKTSFVYTVAENCNFTVAELNASSSRRAKDIKNFIQQQKDKKDVVLLFDELEGFTKKEKDGINYIAEFSKTSTYPIVFTASSLTSPVIQGILPISQCINIPPVIKYSLSSRLASIALNEKIKIASADIKTITSLADGDLRFAINQLEFWQGSGEYVPKDLDHIDHEAFYKRMTQKEVTFDERMSHLVDEKLIDDIQYNIMPVTDKTFTGRDPCSLEDQKSYADALEALCVSDLINVEMERSGDYLTLSDPLTLYGVALPLQFSEQYDRVSDARYKPSKIANSERKARKNLSHIEKFIVKLKESHDILMSDALMIPRVIESSNEKSSILQNLSIDDQEFSKITKLVTPEF